MVDFFEGFRRIHILLQAGIWITTVGVAAFGEPYVWVTYETTGPTAEFTETETSCRLDDRASFEVRLPKGAEFASITLCFRGKRFDDGRVLVPYKIDANGVMWGNTTSSDDVIRYVEIREKQFRLTSAQIERLNSLWWKRRFDGVKDAFLIGGGVSISLWIFSAILGWIVRGFIRKPTPS